jgi:O-antigen ligase
MMQATWNSYDRSRQWTLSVVRAALVASGAGTIALVYTLPLRLTLALLVGVLTVVLSLRWPVAGICAIAIAVPWGSTVPVGSASNPITPTDVLAAELTAAWLISAAVSRRNPLGKSVLAPYIGLYLAAVLVSVTQSTDVKASALEVIKWTEFACVYLASLWFLRTRAHLRLVGCVAVLGGVSQAFLGFYQFILQAGPAAFGFHRAFFRSYGTFDQPNPYAGYLNMVLPLACALSLKATSRAERWLYRGAATVIALALVASQSRGALLAGLAALLVLALCLFPPIRPMAGLAGTVALVGALATAFGVLPQAPLERLLSAVGLGNVSFGTVTDANFSAVERAAHWLAGVRMFAAHPLLGVGIGNYSAAYPAYHPRGWYASLEHAHNYYINIAAEAGILGLLTYTLMVGSALWYIYATLRVLRDPLCVGVVLGSLGALVATSFHNFFDVLYVHGMATLLGCILALASAAHYVDWMTGRAQPIGDRADNR